MWLEVLICLFFAHLVADFVLQTNSLCEQKKKCKWRGIYQYMHALIVFCLSWLVIFDLRFWWFALVIAITHLLIDIWKSCCPEKVGYFVVDQIFHILVLAGISIGWSKLYCWSIPLGVAPKFIAIMISVILCWKPANILIKLTLEHYRVQVQDGQDSSMINAGALIGNLERWLILIFMMMQRYEAIGLLIAAKSIIRFSDKQTPKTEYVLAGTLMSMLIAVLTGIMVMKIPTFCN